MNGGRIVAESLRDRGVATLFTLCGGHISPILVEAKRLGIRVVDTRHEVNAVFAADATARLTGTPGVAAVTAGPGVTNTVTAVRNALLAHSPLVLFGGATAGILKGRGSLQDIDQLALIRTNVKWSTTVKRVRDLPMAIDRAFNNALKGTPGPVFVEIPVDLLYDEKVVHEWFESQSSSKRKPSMAERAFSWYVGRYFARVHGGSDSVELISTANPPPSVPSSSAIHAAARRLAGSSRPALIVGSQAVFPPDRAPAVAKAIEILGCPTWLSGSARGILGANHPLQMRHKRSNALKEADLVILAGVPNDFRLNYGRSIPRKTFVISSNRDPHDLNLNRKPNLGLLGDPGEFLVELSRRCGEADRTGWLDMLRTRDDDRQRVIDATAEEPTEHVNPLALCRAIESAMAEESIVVADGGDFVSSASYILRPRSPLSWLDPGPFGTLGVGAGFAMAAKIHRPDAEVWLLWGDGSSGFSIVEFDTFVRHEIPVIAVVGNDGCWSQIAREQVAILGADTGCMLGRTDYHRVAEGFGGKGLLIREPSELQEGLSQARKLAAEGNPVLVNVWTGATEFRKGSISM